MLNVALTGNIAAGKSTVAELFRSWGAVLIEADRLVRDAQAPGSQVLRLIAARFGADLIGPAGELDRPALRQRVMGDPAARAELERLVHPDVARRRAALLAEARARGARIVVSDIPLLFESLDPSAFDVVVLVDAPEPVRRARLMARRGLSGEDADRMLAAQLPSAEKRARSTYVIDNDADPATLERRAREVWQALAARA